MARCARYHTVFLTCRKLSSPKPPLHLQTAVRQGTWTVYSLPISSPFGVTVSTAALNKSSTPKADLHHPRSHIYTNNSDFMTKDTSMPIRESAGQLHFTVVKGSKVPVRLWQWLLSFVFLLLPFVSDRPTSRFTSSHSPPSPPYKLLCGRYIAQRIHVCLHPLCDVTAAPHLGSRLCWVIFSVTTRASPSDAEREHT